MIQWKKISYFNDFHEINNTIGANDMLKVTKIPMKSPINIISCNVKQATSMILIRSWPLSWKKIKGSYANNNWDLQMPITMQGFNLTGILRYISQYNKIQFFIRFISYYLLCVILDRLQTLFDSAPGNMLFSMPSL